MGRLDGKVALISGGARGQGACEARMFCQEGAKLVFGDILDAEGQDLEKELQAAGLDATYVHLDVTRAGDWQAAVEKVESLYGKLNILINNAGIWIRNGIEDTTEEEWDQVMGINMKGIFLGTKAVLPAMRRAGGGSIVNLSSTQGLVGSGTAAAYTASKGAIRLFSKATAIQQMKDNVRCNSVHPGPIDTEMLREAIGDTEPELWKERMSRFPMGRLGTPEEVAYGVLYLASDESSYVTGSELVIDGGVTAQ